MIAKGFWRLLIGEGGLVRREDRQKVEDERASQSKE
jgi:hypothetical protein